MKVLTLKLNNANFHFLNFHRATEVKFIRCLCPVITTSYSLLVQNPNEETPGSSKMATASSSSKNDEPYDVTAPANREASERKSQANKTNGFSATSEWVSSHSKRIHKK